MMNTTELLDRAYELGYSACEKGKKKVPALDIEFDLFCADTKGEWSGTLAYIELLEQWNAGFDYHTDEDVAKLFPDDDYFQAKIKTKQHREVKHLAKFGA